MQGQRYASAKPECATSPNWGGWRGAPASLQALSENRWNIAHSRRCAKCNQPALRARDFCKRHAGRGARDVQTPARLARRELGRIMRQGVAPGLAGMDVFGATALGPIRFAPLALALVYAWDNRDNDPAAWVAAVRNARNVLR